MATFNGETYIKEQVDSILCQIGDTDEIIISDDGSTDKTLDIINSYHDPRIKVFQNKNTHGYTHNFENALKKSTGDYIFLSDQDDVWLPNKVSTMLPYLKSDNLVLCDAYITNEKLEIKSTISAWRKYKRGYLRNMYKSIFLGMSFAFTKTIKDYCLPIPKSIKGIGHDGWIGFLCELKFNVLYLETPLVLYRRLETSLSHTQHPLLMLRSRYIFFTETMKRFLERK
jgi:glycosyltransferase involved in cell wall biosynthesis